MFKVFFSSLFLIATIANAAEEFACKDGNEKCFVKDPTHRVQKFYLRGRIDEVGLGCQNTIADIKSKIATINSNLPEQDLNIQISKYSWSYIAGQIDQQGRATHVACSFELHSENPKYTMNYEIAEQPDGWKNQSVGCVMSEDQKNLVNSDSMSIYGKADTGLGIALWQKCIVWKLVIKALKT